MKACWEEMDWKENRSLEKDRCRTERKNLYNSKGWGFDAILKLIEKE